MSVERGCGFRTKGAIYAEVGLSPWGSPLEKFLIDPPVVIQPNKFGLTPINMRVFSANSLWHVIDWVGTSYYPTPVHYLEEVRRFGLSTKISLSTDDLKKLTRGSAIYVVHSLAHFDAREFHYADLQNLQNLGYAWKHCPTGNHTDFKDAPMCVGLLWQNQAMIDEPAPADDDVLPYRAHHYAMPSFEFAGYEMPIDFENVPDNYQPAIFARFPITRLVAIRGDDENDARNIDKLTGSDLFNPDTDVLDE
jgi:hypothetical protein